MFRTLIDRLLNRDRGSSRRKLSRRDRRAAILHELQTRTSAEVASWTNAFRKILKQEKRRRYASFQSCLIPALQFEGLEERVLLASDLVFTADLNAVNHTLALDGSGNLQVIEDGAVVLSQPLSSVNSLTITGNDLDNTLFVDFANGNPIPAGGLTYDGVNRGTDFDILDLGDVAVDSVIGHRCAFRNRRKG